MMTLKVQVPDAPSHEIGDEIWHESLADAIRAEAETIAEDAGSCLLESAGDALRERVIAEMTAALVQVGDTYRAPDGVLYSLIERPALDLDPGPGRVDPVSARKPGPVVQEVLRFEDLPLGSAGTRRAVVRWSDGTQSEALTWYADEVLSPVDHVERQ